MNCDVSEATEGLENELILQLSVTSPTSKLILQPNFYLKKKVAYHENRTCDRLHDSKHPKHLSHSIKTKTVTSCVAIVQLHRWFRDQGIGTDALQ